MPLYTYRRADGSYFEMRQRFTEDPLTTCPTTGQPVVRVVQPTAVIFKGSGFYVNDSKNGARSNGTHTANGNGHSADKSAAQGDEISTAKGADSATKEAKETKTAPTADVSAAAD